MPNRLLAFFLFTCGSLFAPGLLAGDFATSKDGKWLAIANRQPFQLTILSTADQSIARVFDIAAKDGTKSRVEGVYTDPVRDNFIVTLRDAPEFWLIATDPDAPPVYDGFVHSREKGMVEALASSEGLFSKQRFELSAPIGSLEFSTDYRTATGLVMGIDHAVVINLNVNHEIGSVKQIGDARRQDSNLSDPGR